MTGFGRSGLTSDGVSAPVPNSQFMRGIGNKNILGSGGWNPSLRHKQDDVGMGWQGSAARTIDLMQNSGWFAGMLEQATTGVVGRGLRLQAMPPAKLFGNDKHKVQIWCAEVEAAYSLWEKTPLECDIEGKRTIPQMEKAAYQSYMAFGEVLNEIPYRRRYFSPVGTKVRMLSPLRLSLRSDQSKNVVNGVKMNRDGMPTGYLALRDNKYMGQTEQFVRARDAYGRPRVNHVFDGSIGQVRGISPCVSILKSAKQFDQLADATLLSSIMQNIFLANVTSEAPTEEALSGYLSAQEMAALKSQNMSPYDAFSQLQAGWYENQNIDVGISGRITSTMPGDEIEFHKPTSPTVDYKTYVNLLLREFARPFGLTFEAATGDYSDASYASIRMAVSENFPITVSRRDNVIVPFKQPIYEAWLEEQIQIGKISFPGGYGNFMRNRMEACRAAWNGSPPAQADDLKTARAIAIKTGLGIMTDQQAANELGHGDIDTIYRQRASEQCMRDDLGLKQHTSEKVQLLEDAQDTETDEPESEKPKGKPAPASKPAPAPQKKPAEKAKD